MNKTMALGAGVAAAVVAAWAGATWMVGQRVQKAMDAQIAPWLAQEGDAPRMLRVTEVNYDKGLLGAARTVTLAVGCGAQSGTLTWRDDIRHGPLPGFAGVGAARIDSRLVLTEAQKKEWQALTGQAEPELSLRTRVGFSGAQQSQLDMPSLIVKSADSGQAELKGVNLQVHIDAQGGARYSATMPTYIVNSPMPGGAGTMRFAMSDVRFEGEGLAPAWWAFGGKGQGGLGKLEVGRVGADGKAETLFSLQDLRMTQDGAMRDGLYSAKGEMQGKGQVGTQTLDTVSMKFRMERMHAPTYLSFMQALMNRPCPGPNPDPKAEAEALMAGLLPLLPHNPEFALDEMQLSLGGHSAKLAYKVGTQGVSAEDLKAPALAPVLMKKAQAQFELDLALPLIAKFSEAIGKPVPPEAIEQGVAGAVAQGMLVREGERVRAKFEWRNGAPTLNGKPMPMPGAPPPAPQ